MAAPTNYYVDPAAGNDTTGDGAIGTPWATVQHALDNITRDATNGDQINIKGPTAANGGTDDVLAAALSLATYGTSLAANAPLVFRGYGSAANDGTHGGLDGDGTYSIYGGNNNYVHFRDLHLHNCGSAVILGIRYAAAMNCELSNTTGAGIGEVDGSSNGARVYGCYFHNIGGHGFSSSRGDNIVYGCHFRDETNKFSRAINTTSTDAIVHRNTIWLNSTAGYGIVSAAHVAHNSVFNNAAGTNAGIWIYGTSIYQQAILNNIVEGWSGSGGAGFEIATGKGCGVMGDNAAYNNTTDFDDSSDIVSVGANESLSASPFAKTGDPTWANRLAWFAPVDTGNVHGGAYVG